LALKNPAVANVQRLEGRAVSVDLTPRRSEHLMHKRTATASHALSETTAVANLTSPPTSQPPGVESDRWASFGSSDTPSTPTAEVVDAPFDDDDDWGEMVQTPTLPTPTQSDPFSESKTLNDTLPTPLIKPSSQEPQSAKAETADSMFASPIVRLQSTISPTSALFRANSFIPLHAEQGPIGPGILKPAKQSVRSTPDKQPEVEVPTLSSVEEAEFVTVAKDDSKDEHPDESSTWVSPVPEILAPKAEEVQDPTQIEKDSTPPTQPATPIQATTDSWADADFSFFESALPVTVSQPPVRMQDASDPFSFFNSPIPASTSPPSKSFSRSPPRDITPPPLQPLTGATSSVQRRKAEEDQIISNILDGLPDLSYMLR
jgi:hypothetical protein